MKKHMTLVVNWLSLGGLFLTLWLVPSLARTADTPPPSKLVKELQRTTRADQQMQKKADRWEQEKQDLISDLQEANAQSRWLAHQIQKYRVYIQKQTAAIAALEQKRAEVRKINQSLEPYLEEIHLRLADVVRQDLDFLGDERQKRLQFLRNTLDDYHLSLSEKCRRMLEALNVEAEYGRTVEAYEAELDLEGQPTAVRIFRLGRLRLFYLSLDGKRVGWLNPDSGQWEPLDKGFAPTISQGIEMAERRRVIDLLDLPMGELNK